MNYRKVVIDGYILGIGETMANGNISAEEYARLTDVFSTMPEAPEGFSYMLREDETWELIKKEAEPADPDLEDSEILEILLGERGDGE